VHAEARQQIARLGRRVLANERLSRPDALTLSAAGREGLHELLYWAHRVREAHFGREVTFCSIGAGKLGGCGEDCKWCAQSARYPTAAHQPSERASADALARAAREAGRAGAAHFGMVNSGRRPSPADLATLEQAATAIRGDGILTPCASVGELDAAAAARLTAAGVRHYNHNLETSRRFYAEMVTTHTYDDRLATLAVAREAGMTLCCGGIFGLGETWEDRIDLALTLRDEVRPAVTPLNFLDPIPGTPLADTHDLTPAECLRIIAVFRLLLPEVDLKVAGGRQVNLRQLQGWMYYAGATSCLVGSYLTTCGRDVEADRQLVADLGLTLVQRFSR